jgi:hypothetical protein
MEGALKSLSELLRGIREGVKDVKEGRVRPWAEVKKELFGDTVELK